jgi:hypothetical protein
VAVINTACRSHSVRTPQREDEPGQPAPVVGCDPDSIGAKLIKHGHEAVGHLGLRITAAGCVAPASAAKVGYEEPVREGLLAVSE